MLYGLLLLSFADAAFTDLGLRLGLIEEMNPLVKEIYNWHIAAFYGLKIVLPLLLIVIFYQLKSKAWINPCILLAVLLYFIVNMYHLIWIYYGIASGQLSFDLF